MIRKPGNIQSTKANVSPVPALLAFALQQSLALELLDLITMIEMLSSASGT